MFSILISGSYLKVHRKDGRYLAGNALHIGIGSDLDGAFGKEQSPYDLETIADLQRIPELLAKRGYSTQDIENVAHGNWLRFIRSAWSKT